VTSVSSIVRSTCILVDYSANGLFDTTTSVILKIIWSNIGEMRLSSFSLTALNPSPEIKALPYHYVLLE